MESITLFIQWCIENLNYWTITLLMTIESSFIPFPSEIVVPPAAYKAAAGELNVFLVILFATIGANLGALVNYYLAQWIGRPLVHSFTRSKVGRMCLLSEEKVQKAEDYFVKNGAISTFVGRLIPGIRQLISIPAGLARMKLLPFLLYTTLGAGIWNGILAGLGYWLHTFVPKDQLMDKINYYNHELKIIFLCVGVLIVAYFIYKAFRRKRTK